ncbi:MAG TPA: flagellar basal body P-ring protein FlgI [Tepidisphaeraceae bacterium]|jgi:hypothetical protein|nr:flagellar basal body P-ring protein FlgI [Tepidisphaeraceae bacterium]
MTPRAKLARLSPLLVASLSCTLLLGCGGDKNKPKMPASRYQTLPVREVPHYLKDTVLQKTNLADIGPFVVSGYGLIANLDRTGGGPYPTAVRNYMAKEMLRHGFGSANSATLSAINPDRALDDPRFTIVEVRGLIPPGARRKQQFDIIVNTLSSSDATSLARGALYQTDLHVLGLRETDPAGSVNVYARAQGPVFVNPAYALNDRADDNGNAKRSLRNGMVLAGGHCMIDRPIRLQLRQPQRSTARQIENRINMYFQDVADRFRRNSTVPSYTVAEAQDEGIINVFVPKAYEADWEHFIGIVQHLYPNASPEFAARQARVLAEEAVKPGAMLKNISYAFEGLGQPALPFLVPLMDATKNSPEVTYAAARAAAFLGDPSAPQALLGIAKTEGHPMQLAATETLGQLPASPGLNVMLRDLLDSKQNDVRVEAYRTLAANADGSIYSKVINEQFVLDIVDSDGPPLIYATRGGIPRIALFGHRLSLDLPMIFTALNGEFQVSSDQANKFVNLFYRGRDIGQPLKVESRPDVAEVIARLGGEGPTGERRFNFGYAEIVALVQGMADQKLISAGVISRPDAGAVTTGQPQVTRMKTAFVLQESEAFEDAIYAAPAIPGTGRPQVDAAEEPRAAGE